MTKTHIEPCPHCGEKPIYEVGKSFGSPSEPDDYYENIYCSNPACIPYESLECWNARVNKEAEFLEEIKTDLNRYRVYYSKKYGLNINFKELIEKIEKFQAGAKNENSR